MSECLTNLSCKIDEYIPLEIKKECIQDEISKSEIIEKELNRVTMKVVEKVM